MKRCYLMLLLMVAFGARGQQLYDVNLIPKELLTHAAAVIRANNVTVDVKGLEAVSQHTKYAVTVLNKNGDREAALYLYYGKTEQIKNIKGTVYDEYGKPISKIAEHDFDDHSDADGFSLFLDDRVKYCRPAVTTYPYTVEYDYETYAKQTMFLPDWNPNKRQFAGTSVEHSSYTLICKPDFNIRYKELNYTGQVVTGDLQGLKTYKWQADNIRALRDEPYSPVDDKLYTTVKIAPEKFSYAGITGSIDNWADCGKFVYDKLLKGRTQLPPQTIEYIKTLTAGITDDKLKAKKIYEYMQQKTRYVSVQIGIGGYQPFTAADVDQQSYGDCKALVNYTQSLLSAVGIESYYVLNMAGSTKQSALPDFASLNQFNHVILCLPFKNDTTWVDCTSKENPFGYLGDFTDDRLVLACTANGGKLLRTPKYDAAGNKQTRNAAFALLADGTLNGEMETRFSGAQYDNRDEMVNESFTEQVKKLKEVYPVENLDVLAYTLKQDKSAAPATTELVKLQARDYVAKNGNRYFFAPNIASRYIKPLKNMMNRATDVYINRGYTDTDEITYTLPDGFEIKTKLINIKINKPFGNYTASLHQNGNKLTYTRALQIIDGNYTKDTYDEMVNFYQTVYDADNYNLELEKK